VEPGQSRSRQDVDEPVSRSQTTTDCHTKQDPIDRENPP
jgi:hypothetical protein